MRALFYDPYLDSLGGGERYVLTLVEALLQLGWQVDIAWERPSVTEPVKAKFGINISQAGYVKNLFGRDVVTQHPSGLWQKYQEQRIYNLVFFVSDGSLPFLFGKQNIVHLQVPFHDVNGRSLANQIKKLSIQNFVVNSTFTKKIVDNEYGINSQVIYPPVDIDAFKPLKKQTVILYAARFSNLLQQKGHDIAIEAFKVIYKLGITDYELWLTGGTAVGADELLQELKEKAKGYPIKFYPDVDFKTLQKLYGQAQLFWSAVGYEVDESKEPEKCEHFGITLVEAMAAGCVPLVVHKGGYKEIIEDGVNGLFWNDPDKLIKLTINLIKDFNKLTLLQNNAINQSRNFSRKHFLKDFLQVIDRT